MATSVNVSATNNADIDGLLAGTEWSGTISYSFPTSSSTYANPYSGGDGEPTTSGFSAAPTQMQAAINYAIALIQSFTNASIKYNGTGSADIMVAQSPAANPTSYAYYPGNYAAGGDVWFGTQYDYTQAQLGNYYFTTALHELGHALGLKHSQETGGVANVAVPGAHDDSEYTVMSYRSYVGGPLTGYTNEAYGYPQSYMANDILALQALYGANYNTQSGNTVYTWSPTTGQEFINGVGQLAPGGGAGGSANRIYETIWDGGGVDTYDLSNYTANLSINLNPGASSVFSTAQLANLGNGHYASGNVYNAYLYNGDARSLADNATGGSGNDTIVGNAIANVLKGGAGNDTITGGGGNDTVDGGTGTDTVVYSGNKADYTITYNTVTQTLTVVDQRAGSPDGTDTVTNVENLLFTDGNVASFALTSSSVVEAQGATELVKVGSNYYLNPITGGVGPSLKSGGVAYIEGHHGAWVPIGAEQVSDGGYDVAWKNSAGLFSFWSTDSNGDYVSTLTADLPRYSLTVETFETTFHQDLNGDGVIGIPNLSSQAAGGGVFGDFDGDGKVDLLQIYGNSGDAYVDLSTGSSFGGWTGWGTGLTPTDQAVDLNGDHKADLVQFWNGFNYVALSTGSGFGPWQQWGQGGGTPTDQFADVNGDGKNDLLQVWHGNVYASLSTGANFTSWQQWGTGATASDRFVDVTGDGRSDLVQIRQDGTVFVGLSTGSKFEMWQQWASGATTSDRVVDLEGDGKADIVQIWNGNVEVAQSTGTSFGSWRPWATGASSTDQLADLTGNGKLDLVQIWHGNAYVALNTGSSFGPWQVWATGVQSSDKLLDMNGDGKMDLLDLKNGYTNVALATGGGFGPWSVWAAPSGAPQTAASSPSASPKLSGVDNFSAAHEGVAIAMSDPFSDVASFDYNFVPANESSSKFETGLAVFNQGHSIAVDVADISVQDMSQIEHRPLALFHTTDFLL